MERLQTLFRRQRRVLVLLAAMLFAVGVSGCDSDPRPPRHDGSVCAQAGAQMAFCYNLAMIKVSPFISERQRRQSIEALNSPQYHRLIIQNSSTVDVSKPECASDPERFGIPSRVIECLPERDCDCILGTDLDALDLDGLGLDGLELPEGFPAPAETSTSSSTPAGSAGGSAPLLTAAAGASVLFVLLGLILPARFPASANITTGDSTRTIRRANPIRLRDCPGAWRVFWRSASLGLFPDGSVTSRTRGAMAVLRATRKGVILESRKGLEVFQTRRGRFAQLEAGPRTPSSGEIYRIGEVVFRIEGGD